jgi:vacuolar protein sorting-associated protein 13A/C
VRLLLRILSIIHRILQIIMNHKLDKSTPRFDVQLLFDEIGVSLDNDQYRDVISLVDMFHFYARQHQYKKYRPQEWEFERNRPRALLNFAGKAILADIHDRHRRWTWAFFAERRDDRLAYVDLFKKKLLNQLAGAVS